MSHTSVGLGHSLSLGFVCVFRVVYELILHPICKYYIISSGIMDSSFEASFVYAEISKAFYSTKDIEILYPNSVICSINIL